MPTVLVNTHEAKSRLSELIRRAEAGEEVILARNGVMVARIVPWPGTVQQRIPGAWRGRVNIAEDFDATDEHIADLFEGSM